MVPIKSLNSIILKLVTSKIFFLFILTARTEGLSLAIEVPKKHRKGNGKKLKIVKATENNLKNINVENQHFLKSLIYLIFL